MTSVDSPFAVAPPPYTLPESSLALPQTTPKVSDPGSEHTTPLPSYTSSPVLHPIITSAPLQKLTSSSSNNIPASTHISPITRYSTYLAITLLGPIVVDTLWLAALNLAGTLFTLFQLPLALLLAAEFNKPTPSTSTNKEYSTGAAQGWIKHITQWMWNLHDELEEAELHPPSHWIR
ncbi:uncharacterized protein UTRI_04467_B [Ustilago trichophora]|uniref:Uncharacterized protein n=1 Tax=Ustilago trichophora TaxID=86804 RepID=A0A5C3EEJ1_9BASI|nr:uncharacterized protein UTRI_04467_B [Ustilago trichophora]